MAIKVPKSPYPAPPIIESVIQLHFADTLSKSQASKLLKRLKTQYQNEVSIDTVSANVDLQNRRTDWGTAQQIRLSSADEADGLMVDQNALTWSRLPPYEGWNVLVERAKRDFDIAHLSTGYRKIDRIGVRFINRFDIPMSDGIGREEEFLTAHLALPEILSPVQNYAWRVEKWFAEQKLRTIVQSAVTAPVIPNTAAILLDIDVICQIDVPAKANKLFERLAEMRKLKNEIFELSITDRARMTFQ